MKYYMPTLVYDEPNAVRVHSGELASYGERALIVTGRNSAKQNGALNDVIAALKVNEREYVIFDEVEENPSVETVMKARDLGVKEGVDFVIGIGGGSPMDAAKAIALMIENRDYDASLLSQQRRMLWLPVVCVPTTCGTGSEVTGVSVLTWHDRKTKASIPYRIFPEMALVDGKYIKNAPQKVIADTAVDAFAHLVESAMSKDADFYSKSIAELGLSLWSEVKDILSEGSERTDEQYAVLMRASTLAGISIAQTGTSLPHALSYIVTYDCGISHGRAVAVFLPWFFECAPADEAKRLLGLAGFADIGELRSFFDRLFSKVDIPGDTLERTIDFIKNNPAKRNSAAFEVTDDALNQLSFI